MFTWSCPNPNLYISFSKCRGTHQTVCTSPKLLPLSLLPHYYSQVQNYHLHLGTNDINHSTLCSQDHHRNCNTASYLALSELFPLKWLNPWIYLHPLWRSPQVLWLKYHILHNILIILRHISSHSPLINFTLKIVSKTAVRTSPYRVHFPTKDLVDWERESELFS